MTNPRSDQARDDLTPARRGRGVRAPVTPPMAPEFDDADLQRGLAAAVLGAMGRLQLRLDALGRQQSESFAALDRRLAALEAAAATEIAPVQDFRAQDSPADDSRPAEPDGSDTWSQ